MRRYHTMARQQAAQRPSGIGRNGSRPSAPIQFEPELAVRAIVFHLVDEGLAVEVADHSAVAAVTRLRRESCRPSIAHEAWSDMTNPQRLEWLMEQTRTASRLVSHDVAILEPAPRR